MSTATPAGEPFVSGVERGGDTPPVGSPRSTASSSISSHAQLTVFHAGLADTVIYMHGTRRPDAVRRRAASADSCTSVQWHHTGKLNA
jgi:hypothetical protein